MSTHHRNVKELFAEHSIQCVQEIEFLSRLLKDECFDAGPHIITSLKVSSTGNAQTQSVHQNDGGLEKNESSSPSCQNSKLSTTQDDEPIPLATMKGETAKPRHQGCSKRKSIKNFDRNTIIAEQEAMATTFLNFLLYEDDDDDKENFEEEQQTNQVEKTTDMEHMFKMRRHRTFRLNVFRRRKKVSYDNMNPCEAYQENQRDNKNTNQSSLFYMSPEKISDIFRLTIESSNDDDNSSSCGGTSTTKKSYVPIRLLPHKNKFRKKTGSLLQKDDYDHVSNNDQPKTNIQQGTDNGPSISTSSRNAVSHHDSHCGEHSYLQQLFFITKLNPFHFMTNIRRNSNRSSRRYPYNITRKELEQTSKRRRSNIVLLQ